jgi:hypothetical protein
LVPVALVLAALSAAPVVHANSAAAPTSSQARASADAKDEVVDTASGDKVICRRDKETGSRLTAKRICMTAKQWGQKTAEERQFLEQRQAQRTSSVSG